MNAEQPKPSPRPLRRLGFVGLGVMGEPMCLHLARRSGLEVRAFDLRPEVLAHAAAAGVVPAADLRELARDADAVLLSLPSGDAVRAAVLGPGGLLEAMAPGSVLVDTGTSPVALARELEAALAARGVFFADAPVARTREAAARGELSIMVGAGDALFDHLRPILSTMGSDVTHCGPVGTGQAAKILNNMLLFQNVSALAEAIALGRRAGLSPAALLDTVSKGSGDSFALRNHGMKAMVPRAFPERAFSTRYAIKDLSYALALAGEAGLDLPAARLTMERLRATEAAGHGDAYFPAMLRIVDPLDEPG